MAGYSGTPLPKKLGITTGTRVALLDAPDGFGDELVPLPADVTLLKRAGSRLNVIVYFTKDRAGLERRFGAVAKGLVANGGLWVAWPKKASGVATDLTEDVVRATGLAHGLVDNKVCAINDVWSGLRFVVPLASRSAWAGA